MKVHYKGVYLKRKKLASGQVRIYYYDRQTGARLPDDPSSSAFLLELERLRRTKNSAVPAERTYAHLIREYRQSLGYTRLKASTRKEYDRHIRYLEEVLAMFPVKDIRRKHIEKIMSKFADKPTLAIAIKRTLSVMMTYAQDRLEWIDFNPCQGMERQRLRGTVGQRPYSEEEIAQFRAANPFGTRARLIFETALGTALRISDIPKIPYHAFLSGEVHILTNKTGAFVVAGVTEQMREAWMAWEKTRRMHSDVDVQFAICSLEGKKLHKRTLSEDMEEGVYSGWLRRFSADACSALHGVCPYARKRLFL